MSVVAWSVSALVLLFLGGGTAQAGAETLTVDRTDNVNISTCLAAANDCSLQGAINRTNADSSPDTINFALAGANPVFTLPQLPTITHPLTINGNTGGATRIVLSGASAGAAADGLKIQSSNVTINSVVVRNFGGDGIDIQGEITNVTITNSRIGMMEVSTSAGGGNLGNGIYIHDGPDNVTVTGNTVIGDNHSYGVQIVGANSTGNKIQNSYIGITSTNNGLGNYLDGVNISAATNTAIGPGNVISTNAQNGVWVIGGTGTAIRGNFIGTNVFGNVKFGNVLAGVKLTMAPGNSAAVGGGAGITPGGACTGDCNLISGNVQDGINSEGPGVSIFANHIGTNLGGTAALGNQDMGIEIQGGAVGGNGFGNVISGNDGYGIYVVGNGTTMVGNRIGTDTSGNVDLGNGGFGIAGGGEDHQVVNNLISGNTAAGIIFAGNGANDGNIKIRGNKIGTNLTGTAAIPNTEGGILLPNVQTDTQVGGSSGLSIGGACTGDCNLISGNSAAGIRLDGASGASILGNHIGTNAAGTAALPNAQEGIEVDRAISSITIGPSNVISGNIEEGVELMATSEQSSNVTVIGNRIGTNSAATAKIGNGFSGIRIANANLVTIGGTGAAGNVISGNNEWGVRVDASAVASIQGNYIGTNSSGANLGNGQHGVILDSNNNIVGGTAAGQGNTIDFNFGGVAVNGAVLAVAGNVISGNSIDSPNTRLGIDLIPNLGVTPNDVDDLDVGTNRLQNFPELDSAALGDELVVSGSLDSFANRQYRIQFFVSDACHQAGFGPGQRFLGEAAAAVPSNGLLEFEAVINSAGVSVGDVITATVRDQTLGDTSEFSECVTVQQVNATATPTPTVPNTNTATPTATATGTATPTPTATVTASVTPTAPVTPSTGATTTPTPTATSPGGTQRIWGDLDCNGAISSRDNQALLRTVLSQPPLSQTEPCPDLGEVISADGASHLWGDLDCNGTISSRDNQALLRTVLSQPPLSQTQPCPQVGETVFVAEVV